MEDTKTVPVYIIKPEINCYAVEALRELGRRSALQGKDKITQEEIDEEIAAFRAGR